MNERQKKRPPVRWSPVIVVVTVVNRHFGYACNDHAASGLLEAPQQTQNERKMIFGVISGSALTLVPGLRRV